MDADVVLAVIVTLAVLLTAVVVGRLLRKPPRARLGHHEQAVNAHAPAELGEDEVTPVSQPPARPIEIDGLTPTGRR